MLTDTQIPDAPAPQIGSHAEAIEIARAFAAGVAAGAIERDQNREVPIAELDELDRTGLLALLVPTDHGGAGARIETLVEVFRLIAAADPSVAQVPQNLHDPTRWKYMHVGNYLLTGVAPDPGSFLI